MCFSKNISILSHITIHDSLFFHHQTQKPSKLHMKYFWNKDQDMQNQNLITVVTCGLVPLLPDQLFPYSIMTLQKYFWCSCSLAPKQSQLGQNWTLP